LCQEFAIAVVYLTAWRVYHYVSVLIFVREFAVLVIDKLDIAYANGYTYEDADYNYPCNPRLR
jgi:hypothetical protein